MTQKVYEGIMIDDGKIVVLENLKKLILENEQALKEREELKKQYTEAIKEAMEFHDVQSIENETFKIAYYPPSTKTALDTKKLKANFEEVYLECLKKSNVKSFIKISIIE